MKRRRYFAKLIKVILNLFFSFLQQDSHSHAYLDTLCKRFMRSFQQRRRCLTILTYPLKKLKHFPHHHGISLLQSILTQNALLRYFQNLKFSFIVVCREYMNFKLGHHSFIVYHSIVCCANSIVCRFLSINVSFKSSTSGFEKSIFHENKIVKRCTDGGNCPIQGVAGATIIIITRGR